MSYPCASSPTPLPTSQSSAPPEAALPGRLAIAVDSHGRVYLAAQYGVNNFITRSAYVVRLNASRSAIDFSTQIMGTPTSLALDPSGAAYIAGSAVDIHGVTTGFLAKVALAGTRGAYTVFPIGLSETVAVDANGNVVLFGGFAPE